MTKLVIPTKKEINKLKDTIKLGLKEGLVLDEHFGPILNSLLTLAFVSVLEPESALIDETDEMYANFSDLGYEPKDLEIVLKSAMNVVTSIRRYLKSLGLEPNDFMFLKTTYSDVILEAIEDYK